MGKLADHVDDIAAFDRDVFALKPSKETSRATVRLGHVRDRSTAADAHLAWLLFSGVWGLDARSVFNWGAIFAFHPSATMLALHDGTEVFAMMQLQEGRRLPCPAAVRLPSVYVSFIEVSPLYRAQQRATRGARFGAFMIGVASDRSFQIGLRGRVGLHATKSSEVFYRRQGFESLDCPNEYNEIYFELSETAAQHLLPTSKVQR